MSLRSSLAIAILSSSIAAMPVISAVAAPIVGDSSFEAPSTANGGYIYNPTGTPWTFANSTGVTANGGPFYSGSAPDGVQAAFLQSNANSGMGSISQTITGLQIGGSYQVTFYLASRPGNFGSTPVDVTFGGADLGSYTNTGTAFVLERSSILTAVTSTSALLTFTATNIVGSDNDVVLDAVSVVQTGQLAAAVPEPASVLLVAIGAVGVLIGRRSRRTA